MATKMSKQDKQGVRTAAELERKYNIGKSFAEVIGIATDAQQAADEAAAGVDGLDEKLDHTEIFNRLTNNGELQGIYRGDDGEIYINATYIKSGEFVADLIKSGVIKSVAGTVSGVSIDLNSGIIFVVDTNKPKDYILMQQGTFSVYREGAFADYDGDCFQLQNEVSGNCIFGSVYGTRAFINGLTAPVDDLDAVNKAYVDERSEDYIVEQGTSGDWTYTKWNSGKAECYQTAIKYVCPSTPWGTGHYYEEIPSIPFPSGLFFAAPTITATIEDDGGNFLLTKKFSTFNETGGFFVVSLVSFPSSTVAKLHLSAKGRWK
jgi:hypothetical protein